MENASKALIMAASTLIGIMIIAFMVYMFSDGRKLNRSHEISEAEKVISAFNADFQVYESFTDSIVNPSNNKLYNTDYARFNAAKNLNLISDVITAVNSAYDINYRNSKEYKMNDYIEYENGLVIVIDLGGETISGKSKFVIFPNKNVKYGYVYGVSNLSNLMARINNHDKNIDIDSSFTKISTSTFLEKFRESKVELDDNNNAYTVYRYYFAGKIDINENTGKVNKITFNLVKNGNF